MPQFAEHFNRYEFACQCGCGFDEINQDVVLCLDAARSLTGIPFIITSGCRCEGHNKAVGGVDHSPHKLGMAVDIKATTSHERFLIVSALLDVGFERIGIGKDFIHADLADTPKHIEQLMWLY